MRSLVLTAAAALLFACSSEPDAPNASPEAATFPTFDGLDLSRPVRLIGTEPFWSIDLTGSEVVYSGVDRPEQRAPQPRPSVQGTVATLETATSSGTEIVITLTATECSDGMSDRTYPVTALAKVAGETLMGCAAPTASLASGDTAAPSDGSIQPAV
jgi:uncharacterized membrane protein